jgi:hypothetical protein
LVVSPVSWFAFVIIASLLVRVSCQVRIQLDLCVRILALSSYDSRDNAYE